MTLFDAVAAIQFPHPSLRVSAGVGSSAWEGVKSAGETVGEGAKSAGQAVGDTASEFALAFSSNCSERRA